jgi:hypothetical protein
MRLHPIIFSKPVQRAILALYCSKMALDCAFAQSKAIFRQADKSKRHPACARVARMLTKFLSLIRRHLAASVVILFAAIAAVPVFAAITRIQQQGKPVTVEEIKKEIKYGKEKDEKEKNRDSKEIKTVLRDAKGHLWLGGKAGLFHAVDQVAQKVEGSPADVRGLALGGNGEIWAASKMGLYVQRAGKWEQISTEDVHDVSITADQKVIICSKKSGVMVSVDSGKTWQPEPLAAGLVEEHHD